MWNLLTRSKRRRSTSPTKRPLLHLELLEAREVPAINIVLDYSLDTQGFFNNPEARATMDLVASELGNSISAELSAIMPSGSDTWTAVIDHPATGAQLNRVDMSIPANSIRVFVGGRDLPDGVLGRAGPGGAGAGGSQQWIDTVFTRGWNGFSLWGGDAAFDTMTNWHFGQTTNGLDGNEFDFYSVATHEMGHVLGIGTAQQWDALISNGRFNGPNSVALFGGPVPVVSDNGHWADDTTINGQPVSMDPSIGPGEREVFTVLDLAGLQDIGWILNTNPLPPGTLPPGTLPPGPSGNTVFVFTGNLDGTVSFFQTVNNELRDTNQRLTPFVGYRGAIRVASGDFNGDGVNDFAFTTGAGPQAVVQIVNGLNGSIMVGQTVIFAGFRGGLFLAAADIDGDGKAELAVSADAGAGPHIQTFRVIGGALTLQSSFFAFDNPDYRGGARVAAGDINRDGFADLVVTTGEDAEGRVASYTGIDLRNGIATRLFFDFIPFAGLWAPLNAAVADLDGDGFADLAITPDNGPAHIKVWSGIMLTAFPEFLISDLPLSASFICFEDTAGARIAIRDTNRDGLGELAAGNGNPFNPIARVFTLGQMAADGGFAPIAEPFDVLRTFDGIYVG